MEYLPLIGTVALLNLLAAISPGPDFVVTVRNSLCYSQRAGIFTALGISLALCVHLFYCAAGIGYIISTSVVLFSILKLLGAAYLIYLGVSSFIAKGSRIDLAEERTGTDLTRLKAFRMGFLTNVLNPKATLFFLSLFTLVIGNSTPVYIILTISAIIILTAFTWFTIVSIFLAQQNVQRLFLKYEKIINRTLGGFLVFLGVKIILTFY
ncbi:MAG TPA: LysE family translocator [Prolixibacteraceae bacterium]|nr:LysE family translocator [Prolixibacteraceae bacterium]